VTEAAKPRSFVRRWLRAEMALGVTAALFGVLLLSRPSGLYPWVKAVHVIAIIAWMAGMLYLPRLFVYHCEAERGSVQSETFKVMERRLLRIIMNPAMVVAWALGLWLAWDGGLLGWRWLEIKIVLVLIMSGVHGFFVRCVRDFAADQNQRPQKFYRIINEVPTALMIGIVLLAVAKPF
jgi:putative membrane protein